MPHSYVNIWIHSVWGTENRQPLLVQEIEYKIYSLIKEQYENMGCPVRIINGTENHVHSLFLLSPQKSIAEVIKQVKGYSSHFINQNKLSKYQFNWQGGYAAFAVSQSNLDKVFYYIKNQKEHHRERTFMEEYEILLKKNQG
jgi:putative transposase